jgi:hypothetical protein
METIGLPARTTSSARKLMVMVPKFRDYNACVILTI